MSPLEFDPTLETGDPVVDRQHRAIYELFNELETAADNRDSILRTLDYLTEHVLTHFSTEEDLMRRIGFPAPAMEDHVAEHKSLTEAVRAFVIEFHVGSLEHTGPLIAFLRQWLVDHVNGWDRELVDFARTRDGVALPPPHDLPEGERAQA